MALLGRIVLLGAFLTLTGGVRGAGAQTCTFCGDANGDGQVNIVDALFVGQHTVGLRPDLACEELADVLENGAADIVDALFMAQHTVGTRPILCFRIETPQTLSLFSVPTTNVSGRLTGEATVACNGVAAQVDQGQFVTDVPLEPSQNVVNCLATRLDGMVASASVNVTLDDVAPTLVIESPRDGLVTAETHVDVVGTVNDVLSGFGSPPTQVTINGIAANVSNRAFVAANVPLIPGPNVLAATAVDVAGNIGMTSINVQRETQAGQRIRRVSGNNQVGQVSALLAQPLAVELLDIADNGVADRLVTFTVTRGSGTLTGAPGNGQVLTVASGPDGRASAQFRLGLNAGAGNHRLTATATGFVGEVDFCATAVSGIPDHIVVISGDNQEAATGEVLPMPLIAAVVDQQGNPVEGLPVTFTVLEGQGSFSGAATFTTTTGFDGQVAATYRVGPAAGVNNNRVSAAFEALNGLPAIFTASGIKAGLPADTSVSGVVLDNSDVPIPGVTAFIAETSLSAVSDEEGRFRIDGVPVGPVLLLIHGGSTTRDGVWPNLEFELVTVAGADNTVDGPIRLPVLDETSSKIVGGNQDVTLEMAAVPGASLTVFANSATFADGSSEGRVSITQVNFDKVPMPPPNGSQFAMAWTVQPPGVIFDPPARVTIPNVGAPPGSRVEMFWFDHDLSIFVAIGTASVSPDGSIVQSDPGFGVGKSGWGGCTAPPPPTTCAVNCDTGHECRIGEVVNPPCSCKFTNAPNTTPCGENEPGSCKAMGQCVGGSCETETLPAGTPCMDGKLCTEPDECDSSGKCAGKMIADGVVQQTAVSFAFLNSILQGIQKFLDLTKIGNFNVPDVTGELSRSTQEICCEAKMTKHANKVGWGGSLSFSTPLDTGDLVLQAPPWSGQFQKTIFGRSVGVAYGITVRLMASFGFEVSGEKNTCTDKLCISGAAKPQVDIQAGLIGAVENPGVVPKCGPTMMDGCSLIKATGTAKSGLALGVQGDCEMLSGGFTWPGLKFALTFTALEGTKVEFMVSQSFAPDALKGGPIPGASFTIDWKAALPCPL